MLEGNLVVWLFLVKRTQILPFQLEAPVRRASFRPKRLPQASATMLKALEDRPLSHRNRARATTSASPGLQVQLL